MTYTITTRVPYLVSTHKNVSSNICDVPTTSSFTILSNDALSFMEVFSYPNLKKLEASLEKAAYTKNQVNEIITGLRTLPGYKRD